MSVPAPAGRVGAALRRLEEALVDVAEDDLVVLAYYRRSQPDRRFALAAARFLADVAAVRYPEAAAVVVLAEWSRRSKSSAVHPLHRPLGIVSTFLSAHFRLVVLTTDSTRISRDPADLEEFEDVFGFSNSRVEYVFPRWAETRGWKRLGRLSRGWLLWGERIPWRRDGVAGAVLLAYLRRAYPPDPDALERAGEKLNGLAKENYRSRWMRRAVAKVREFAAWMEERGVPTTVVFDGDDAAIDGRRNKPLLHHFDLIAAFDAGPLFVDVQSHRHFKTLKWVVAGLYAVASEFSTSVPVVRPCLSPGECGEAEWWVTASTYPRAIYKPRGEEVCPKKEKDGKKCEWATCVDALDAWAPLREPGDLLRAAASMAATFKEFLRDHPVFADYFDRLLDAAVEQARRRSRAAAAGGAAPVAAVPA